MKRFLLGLSISCAICCGVLLPRDMCVAFATSKTKSVSAGDLKLEVPETWKQSQPSSNFRLAQFEVPAAKGDSEPGEIVIFYFQGGGGSAADNIKRWRGQFQPDERKEKIVKGKAAQGDYTLVDIQGTWNKPIGPPIQQKTKPMPGARVMNVLLQTEKGGSYFIRLSGPAKTVDAAVGDFRNSFGGSADSEKEVKSENDSEK